MVILNNELQEPELKQSEGADKYVILIPYRTRNPVSTDYYRSLILCSIINILTN